MNFLLLAHVGEEIEEHPETGGAPIPAPPTIDVGFYFAGGVIALAIIGFIVYRFIFRGNKRALK